MTKPLEALIADMKAAAEKATQGEWWSDVIETGGTHGNGDDCIEGFHSYAVYDQNNHSLLDMTNSTAALITVEDDGEYCMAWDEVAKRNAEHISFSCPINVLALIAALEQSHNHISRQEEIMSNQNQRIAELEGGRFEVEYQEPYEFADNKRAYGQRWIKAIRAAGITVQGDE